MKRARTRGGCAVQIIGGILWLGSGLASCILISGMIADAVGTWVAVIGFIFFPVLFALTPLIYWLITGAFPWLYLILWLAGWGGALVYYLGSRIKGEEP